MEQNDRPQLRQLVLDGDDILQLAQMLDHDDAGLALHARLGRVLLTKTGADAGGDAPSNIQGLDSGQEKSFLTPQ